MNKDNPFIVSSDWLNTRLGTPGVTIVDASWYLPAANRDPKAEYQKEHIPGAVFFDQDVVCDPQATLPHTLPSAAEFGRHASSMGITVDDIIVVYDGNGFFSAPRAWWMFRVMGAMSVYVLDGGLKGWKAEGRPVTDEITPIAPTSFHAILDEKAVVRLGEMRDLVAHQNMQIADARGKGRFTAVEREPRPGIHSGHMPGARNVPATILSDGGYFKSADDICKIFNDAGVDPEKPVVASCGSGITAAVLVLGLQGLGNKNVRLYDGSWTEWGSLSDTPVEEGEAK